MIVMAVTDDVERKFDMYPEWYRVVCWSLSALHIRYSVPFGRNVTSGDV